MIIKEYDGNTVRCEFSAQEYTMLMAIIREATEAISNEEFISRVGTEKSGAIELGVQIRDFGESFGLSG
jgi:hypothetical protein